MTEEMWCWGDSACQNTPTHQHGTKFFCKEHTCIGCVEMRY